MHNNRVAYYYSDSGKLNSPVHSSQGKLDECQFQFLTNFSLCLSQKTVIVSKAELIGINRGKQNKTRHHQRCLYLSFHMPIIPALFYLLFPLFFLNFFFPIFCLLSLAPIPFISRPLLLLPPHALSLVQPLPCFVMDSCRLCVCSCVSVCVCCLSVLNAVSGLYWLTEGN